jgi:hypothetical protein
MIHGAEWFLPVPCFSFFAITGYANAAMAQFPMDSRFKKHLPISETRKVG